MKKMKISLLLALLLCLASVVAMAMENAVPAAGDKVSGFVVDAVEDYAAGGCQMVSLTHEATGAKALWLASDEQDRVFTITFRTPTCSNRGEAHVFEHAALAGSHKYPDPNLFFNMMTGTYSTYLNALTDTTFTTFVASSLSEKQLMTDMDVILSGVFDPLVCESDFAMQREAYRYALESPDADLALLGSVYSEMCSSYYANEAFYKVFEAMFPGSFWGSVSGGVPGEIEKLTRQDLVDFHDTFYHPSNSLVFLSGDLDLAAFLGAVDTGYFAGFEPKDVDVSDKAFVPVQGFDTVTLSIAADEDNAGSCDLIYCIPVRGADDAQWMMFTELAPTIFSDSDSPMGRLMMERYPQCIYGAQTMEGAESLMLFEIDGADGVVPEDFIATVNEGIALTLASDANLDAMRSVIRSVSDMNANAIDGGSVGSSSYMTAADSFALVGDPAACFRLTDTANEGVTAYAENGEYKALIEAHLANPDAARLFVLNYVPGLREQRAADAANALVSKKAAMTDEEINDLVKQTADFAAWADANDQQDLIRLVQAVSGEELPESIPEFPYAETEMNGMRVITSTSDDIRKVRIQLYLDASAVASEDLMTYAAMVEAVPYFAAGDFSTEDVDLISTRCGVNVAATTLSPASDRMQYTPALLLSIYCEPQDVDDAFDLLHAMLFDAHDDDAASREYLRYDFATAPDSMRILGQYYGGTMLLSGYANAALYPDGAYMHHIGDENLADFCAGISGMDDDQLSAFLADGRAQLARVLTKDVLAVTAYGPEADVRHALERTMAFVDALPEQTLAPNDYSESIPLLPRRIAICVPGESNTNYTAMRTADVPMGNTGALEAYQNLASSKALMPLLRYRNGVYSPSSSISDKVFSVLAYSDPSIGTTFDTAIPQLSGMLKDAGVTREDIDGCVLSAYSGYNAPMSAENEAMLAVDCALAGYDCRENYHNRLASMRSMQSEDCDAYADLFGLLAETGIQITVGSPTAINAEKDRFDMIVNWYIK